MSALNITSKPMRTDYKIIQTMYRFVKYLAFTPIDHEKVSNKLLKCFLKNYPLLLMIAYLGATIFSFYQRVFIYMHYNISQAIMDACQGFMEFIFIEQVVIYSVLKKNNWRKLMKNIEQLERKFNNLNVKDSRLNFVRLKICVYHILYFAVHIYDSVANWHFLSYGLAFAIFRVTTYYLMTCTLLLTFICNWIKNRYLYLNNFLNLSVSKSLKFSILQRENVSDKLAEFSTIYKNLYLIVQEVDVVFGTSFFLIAICTVLEILNAVNYAMLINTDTTYSTSSEDVMGINILYLVLYAICYCQTIMSCDYVIKSAKSVQKTSLMLHEKVENRELGEEFLNLAYYIQGLTPEFSAAGFWTVNQTNLSTLFSCVMTYVIIIIQLNIALQ